MAGWLDGWQNSKRIDNWFLNEIMTQCFNDNVQMNDDWWNDGAGTLCLELRKHFVSSFIQFNLFGIFRAMMQKENFALTWCFLFFYKEEDILRKLKNI